MEHELMSLYTGVFQQYGTEILQSQLTTLTMLTFAVFVTSFAQVAKNRVFLDCSTCVRAGLIVQMIAVLAFPPKESCKIRVSFESL